MEPMIGFVAVLCVLVKAKCERQGKTKFTLQTLPEENWSEGVL